MPVGKLIYPDKIYGDIQNGSKIFSPFENIFITFFEIPVEDILFIFQGNKGDLLKQRNKYSCTCTVKIFQADIHCGNFSRIFICLIDPFNGPVEKFLPGSCLLHDFFVGYQFTVFVYGHLNTLSPGIGKSQNYCHY